VPGLLRYEKPGLAVLVLALVAVPAAVHGWPSSLVGNAMLAAVTAAGWTVLGWRRHPRLVTVAGAGIWLAAVGILVPRGVWFPDPALVIMAMVAAVAALGWTGRGAWLAGAGLVAYLGLLWWLLSPTNPVPLVMFSVPGFAAGTVLRQRAEAADALAQRGRELEEERELFADLSMRHERARIAAELHDIVGHAISVMIIQAAAGQRLVDRDPPRARQAFAAIADSARQGREDLGRLVELLGGTEVGGGDLTLIDELVTRAARTGLDVTCRFSGDRDGVGAPAAHLALRVVQESLTNALRHSPGAAVRVGVDGSRRRLTVRVENGPAAGERPAVAGTGRGLVGLRERVQQQGGRLTAGPTGSGGWRVEVSLPA
jgi:signal transduction histidine kinase